MKKPGPEPRAALGVYDETTGRYTLFAGSGGVVRHKNDLAEILQVPETSVRVVAQDVGGNFGTRNSFYPEFALVAWAVIPFDAGVVLANINVGVLYLFAISSLGVYGVIMAGWASNSKYPFLGALRSAAQMVSYEIAMGLAVVSAVLMTSLNDSGTGTLSMIDIVRAQNAQHIWFVFKFFPLGFIAFFIFAVAMVRNSNC